LAVIAGEHEAIRFLALNTCSKQRGRLVCHFDGVPFRVLRLADFETDYTIEKIDLTHFQVEYLTLANQSCRRQGEEHASINLRSRIRRRACHIGRLRESLSGRCSPTASGMKEHDEPSAASLSSKH
jgi:hypothetical protein